MATTESKSNLAKAVISVMKAVKNIDKNSNVGSGSNSYKGVSDKDVKKVIGEAMAKNGLCLLPIEVEPTTNIHRWEEQQTYQSKTYTKQKQSVFTEVRTKYLLLHESGESQVLEGYGHGNDSMDKSAGKATTYALKYTMLYAFLTPTGHIDDADNTHSDEQNAPQKSQKPAQQQSQAKQEQKPSKKKMTDAVLKKALESTKIDVLEKAFATYELTQDQAGQITMRIEALKNQSGGKP